MTEEKVKSTRRFDMPYGKYEGVDIRQIAFEDPAYLELQLDTAMMTRYTGLRRAIGKALRHAFENDEDAHIRRLYA